MTPEECPTCWSVLQYPSRALGPVMTHIAGEAPQASSWQPSWQSSDQGDPSRDPELHELAESYLISTESMEMVDITRWPAAWTES